MAITLFYTFVIRASVATVALCEYMLEAVALHSRSAYNNNKGSHSPIFAFQGRLAYCIDSKAKAEFCARRSNN